MRRRSLPPSAEVPVVWSFVYLALRHVLVASGGTRTGPRDCEAAPHTWRRRGPETTTLRRLIGSSVVVGPARVSRRHEGPSRMVSADGAGSRGRRGGRPGYKPGWGLDPHRLLRSRRRTWPADCLCCQFGLAGLVSAGRRADAARLGGLREGPLGPTSAGPSAAAAPCWERDPKRRSGTSRAARAGGGGWLPTGCAAPALPCQVADS